MKTLVIILLALAVVLFLASAAGLQSKTRFNLIALGLASWALSQLVPMLRNLSVALALFALVGCQAPGTPEQQEAARRARGKNVAKLEQRAWNLGGFLANIAGNIVTNTVTNFANEQLGRSTRGFAK